MSYATLAQVKAAMSLGATDQVDDAQIEAALNAAVEAVNAHCARSFDVAAGTATTRVYAPTDELWCPIDDATTVTLVETWDGSAWSALDADDWQADPVNGIKYGATWPIEALISTDESWPVSSQTRTARVTVRVTGTWGWPAVPAAVTQATIQTALRFWKRLDTPLGFGGGPDTGLLYVSRQIDGDVAQMLRNYRALSASALGIA